MLERTSASVPALPDLENQVRAALTGLGLAPPLLRGRRIAVSVGSRGIASLKEIVRAICAWLKLQGAQPFVFPAMGSHGGATADGQRKVLEEYGVTADFTRTEIRSSMDVVHLGTTPEGIQVFVDRNAWEADAILVMNRVKPHTEFYGKIESGLLKMMAVGMGKLEGARECHRLGWKHGFEPVIRSMAAKVLATGKILCGLGVVENELHEICAVRAARAEAIAAAEEEALAMSRPLVPAIPFRKLDVLIVDEIGKNVSGTGMDTKVIGRGVGLPPGAAPEIRMIYIRDLTPESDGNALGVGLADLMHERLYRKIDVEKTYVNVRTSLNPRMVRLPMNLPSDGEALQVALGHVGSPGPDRQRVLWIRNTLRLDRIAVAASMVGEARQLAGWRVSRESRTPQFDSNGDLVSLFH